MTRIEDVESASLLSPLMKKLNDRSLMILREDMTLLESKEEGMKPLLKALRRFGRTGLRGTTVVDKIIGKAAALLIAYFRPREVYCATLSRGAEEVFKRYRLTYHAARVVPEILSRSGHGLCPFEKAVINTETPTTGYRMLILRSLSFSSQELK